MENSSKHISIWHDNVALPTFTPLNRDLNFDFVVIGGGISGITLSYLLQKQGAQVALVEAKRLGSGVTGTTTAHLCYIPDISLPSLIKNIGKEKACLVIDSWKASIDFIENLSKENKISCDFKRVPGFLFTESKDEVSQIEKAAEAASTLGISSVLTTNTSLPFGVKMAAQFENHGQMHPLKFIKGIVESFITLGGKVFDESRVMQVVDGEICEVKVETGSSIRAKKVVMATHTPFNFNIIQTKVAPYRSYVLGVRLKEEIKLNGVFYDTKTPYNYIRSYYDTNGQLIIIGGADHKTGSRSDTSNCFQQMEEFARARFNVKSIDYMWSGQTFEPADGLPYIGKLPLNENVYVITGLSGNGITGGVVASMLLSDLLFDRHNPLADILSPERIKPIAEGKQFINENANTVAHFIKDRITIPHSNLQDLDFEEGKIINIDGKKVAVYHDQDGKYHALSPVCTHLGCIVQWNNSEKTWDCPCHGGRFNATGEVLESPPTTELKPLNVDIKVESKLGNN